jgi:diguanylate cyclase (GGDEF)-like protein
MIDEVRPGVRFPRGEAFRREGRTLRTLPFLLVAIAAEASLALPPGPASTTDTVISALLLAATIGCFFLPWRMLPSGFDVFVPLLYTGSVLALILAAGGSSTGIGLVILLPLVWTALYLEPWKSGVVVAGLVIVQIVTSYVPVAASDAVRLRKIVFFLVIGALLAYSIIELRIRMARSNDRSEASNRALTSNISQLVMISELADMLHSCVDRSDAYEVIAHSTEKMFPGGGSVSILNASRDLLEPVAAWGNYPDDEPPFPPHDCWALRRGHVYESKPGDLYCKHLTIVEGRQSLCRPLLAQGETIGMMSVSLQVNSDGSAFATPIDGTIQQLVLTVAEQIATSVANFQLRESLRDLSIRDPLTNLFNRRFMEETLNRELSAATRSQEELSILQIDVDYFKVFNDTYGHEVGDDVLKAMGELLLLMFRDSDVSCRSGGEEFTVVLPNCSLDNAERRARDLQECTVELDFPFRGKGARPASPTLSIGIATSPLHGASSSTLLRAGDLALYAAKNAGRSRIVRATDPASAGTALGLGRATAAAQPGQLLLRDLLEQEVHYGPGD